jgi:hypothetical protein
MMKHYITPRIKEAELVIHPAGKKDPQGNRIPRKAIQFYPNEAGCGSYKTSDPKEQEFLDNHEYMKTGELMVMGAENAPKVSVEAPVKTRVGMETTSSDEPPAAPEAKERKVKAAKVKK